ARGRRRDSRRGRARAPRDRRRRPHPAGHAAGGHRRPHPRAGRRPPPRPLMARLDLDAVARHRGVDLGVWPPAYAPGYRPHASGEHWRRGAEGAAPAAREELIFGKLRRQVTYAWETSEFYRRKWQAAGVSPDTLRSLDDLRRFPVVQKAELRRAQAAAPPFGDY